MPGNSFEGILEGMKIRRFFLLLACIFGLVPLFAQQSPRVGFEVKEPKLLKTVAIEYPEEAKILGLQGPVTIKLLINKKGQVEDIDPVFSIPLLLEPTVAAAKHFQFAPTVQNGKPIAVTAIMTVHFVLRQTPGFLKFQDGSGMPGGLLVGLSQKGLSPIIARIDQDGNYISVRGERSNANQPLRIIPAPHMALSLLEERLKTAQDRFSPPHELWSPEFRFPDGNISYFMQRKGLQQLYHSTILVTNGSHLIQLAGNDPDVKPPQLDLDLTKLGEQAFDLTYQGGSAYFCTLFVDKDGSILGLEHQGYPLDPIYKALANAHVIKPGMRHGIPVPTAVLVAIQVPIVWAKIQH